MNTEPRDPHHCWVPRGSTEADPELASPNPNSDGPSGFGVRNPTSQEVPGSPVFMHFSLSHTSCVFKGVTITINSE